MLPELFLPTVGRTIEMKVIIFIDFWNFQLTLNECASSDYRLDWMKISPWIMAQTEKIIGQTLQYQGTQVYISHDPRSSKDHKLRDFAMNVYRAFLGCR